MYIKIIKNIEKYHKLSLEYFEENYINKYKKKESIVARYIISKIIEKKYGIKKYIPNFSKRGLPILDKKIFWSISHKKDLIFIGINNNKIGVDIELFKNRDTIVLNYYEQNEYDILGGKNFENFYILWTAKESIIKYNLGELDDMKNIELFSLKKINKVINNANFCLFLIFKYNFKKIIVLSGKKNGIYYSICIKKNDFGKFK